MLHGADPELPDLRADQLGKAIDDGTSSSSPDMEGASFGADGSGAQSTSVLNADDGVTRAAKKPSLTVAGGAASDASANDGRLEGADQAKLNRAQTDGSSSLARDGDRSYGHAGHTITTVAGADVSVDPAGKLLAEKQKVIYSTHQSRILASELYRLEAPNDLIRATGRRMSYCDVVRSKPRARAARANAKLNWRRAGLGF